jgi:hypothetical protein
VKIEKIKNPYIKKDYFIIKTLLKSRNIHKQSDLDKFNDIYHKLNFTNYLIARKYQSNRTGKFEWKSEITKKYRKKNKYKDKNIYIWSNILKYPENNIINHIIGSNTIGQSFLVPSDFNEPDPKCIGFMIDFDDHYFYETIEGQQNVITKIIDIFGAPVYAEKGLSHKGLHFYYNSYRIKTSNLKKLQKSIQQNLNLKIEIVTTIARLPMSNTYTEIKDVMTSTENVFSIKKCNNLLEKFEVIQKAKTLSLSLEKQKITPKQTIEQIIKENTLELIRVYHEEKEKFNKPIVVESKVSSEIIPEIFYIKSIKYESIYAQNKYLMKININPEVTKKKIESTKFNDTKFSFGEGTRYDTLSKIVSYSLRYNLSIEECHELVIKNNDGTSKDLKKWTTEEAFEVTQKCYEHMKKYFENNKLNINNTISNSCTYSSFVSNLNWLNAEFNSLDIDYNTYCNSHINILIHKQKLYTKIDGNRYKEFTRIFPIIYKEMLGKTIFSITNPKNRNNKCTMTQKKFNMRNYGVQFDREWKNKLCKFYNINFSINNIVKYILKNSIFISNEKYCYNPKYKYSKYFKFNKYNFYNIKSILLSYIEYFRLGNMVDNLSIYKIKIKINLICKKFLHEFYPQLLQFLNINTEIFDFT